MKLETLYNLVKFIAIMATALVAFALTVNAAAPKAAISGPTTGIAGEILELDASASEGATHFLWKVHPPLAGRRQIEQCGTDGKRVRIASLPGTYVYTLVVSNADGADRTNGVVSIPGDSPSPIPVPTLSPQRGPNPTPVPNPQPVPIPVPTPTPQPVDPSFPAGQFDGLPADVYKWAMAVSYPGGDSQRKSECKALADALDSVAASSAAGIYSAPLAGITAGNIVDAMLKANRKALGDRLPAWQNTFSKALTPKLTAFYNQGRLKGGADWAVLLREAAMGLRAAGQR